MSRVFRFLNDLFQSTPPSREATVLRYACSRPTHHFNPRPPHGRRQIICFSVALRALFQSTPPSREATLQRLHGWQRYAISIHAPLTGGDL